jgi:tetratricopeptide (TPR) repeat protein
MNALLIAIVLAVALAPLTIAQTDAVSRASPRALMAAAAQPADTTRLGMVHFPTSCNDAVQKRFDQALAYQHSFWYQASYQAFQEVLKADPSCAIAYWGIALSLMRIPWIPPSPENLAAGWAAVQKGQALGAKTERERDYIDAIAAFYADHQRLDHQTRLKAYLSAVENVAQKYPDDEEAQIYYALVLNVAASPADKTYANQLKAAAILAEIVARRPDHPGAARAAENAGDVAKARHYYGRVVELAAGADSARPDIAAAKSFMARLP